MKITELIRKRRVFFDGGTGTVLQSMGLPAGTPPEDWNLTNPEKITELHKSYISAGCDIIKTNTFGINSLKYQNFQQYIAAAIGCAKKAVDGQEEKYIAFDMGPTGKLLEPFGELSFEKAVSVYAENVAAAVKCGVDLILIETMNDSLETKAAVLAAKENSNLPVFVTNVYDQSGKLMTGANPQAMIAMLEGLRVDALGMNCSLGPDKMLPLMEQFSLHCSVPVIVNPNAGLPSVKNGKTVYGMDAEEFSDYAVKLATSGGHILGGCCGTTPEYIKKVIEKTKKLPFQLSDEKHETVISSGTHAVFFDSAPVLIGERINPTGKKKFKEALRNNDLDYILGEAVKQADKGVQVLDVNVGLPEIDEEAVMQKTVMSVQAVTDLPLQIDTSSPTVMEKALRLYNGKPLINSVNGKAESMDSIFPLAAKYGGVVIALTLDENGIPDTADGRVKIAEKIISAAGKYGIPPWNIIVDPLTMAVSADSNSGLKTLEAVKKLNSKGIKTCLGVSNISFGLPIRERLNTAFFSCALESGLTCAIMNPFSDEMMWVYRSFMALHGMDSGFSGYITAAQGADLTPAAGSNNENLTVSQAVIKGLSESAKKAAAEMLLTEKPLDIINNEVIPALNTVGKGFEEKRIFLPQLLMSAEAASAAFEIIKSKLPKDSSGSKGKIILATVKGDIHDIGKNIVRVMLESYGFEVIDLGRDVEPQKICECAINNHIKLVGLSALMTTTVPAMDKTVKLLKNADSSIKVIVGGAVLTQEYSDMIGADCYSPDAMNTVRYAEKFFGII